MDTAVFQRETLGILEGVRIGAETATRMLAVRPRINAKKAAEFRRAVL